jgi:hypothetical protein
MSEAGQKNSAIGWNDEELDQQIIALELVTSYFNARQDCGIIYSALMAELESFDRMKRARKQMMIEQMKRNFHEIHP